MEWIELIFAWFRKIAYFLWFSHNGYVAHFVVGIIIGGFVSMAFFKSSGNKMQAVIIGFAVAALIGLAKELADPFIGRNRDAADFYYTCYGGFLGCMMVFSKRMLQLIFPER